MLIVVVGVVQLAHSLWRSSTEVFRQVVEGPWRPRWRGESRRLPDFGTVPILGPVAGIVTSTVWPLSACTHSPLIRLAWRMKWLVFWSMTRRSAAGGRWWSVRNRREAGMLGTGLSLGGP